MQNNCAAKIAFRIPVQTVISREIKLKGWTNWFKTYTDKTAVASSPSKGSCNKHTVVYLTEHLNKLTKECCYKNTYKDKRTVSQLIELHDTATWKAQNESGTKSPGHVSHE